MIATLTPTSTDVPAAANGLRPACRNEQANYAVRRAVAALVLVLGLALVAVAASASIGALLDVDGRPAAASDIGTAPVVRIHVAQPGDTLWSIADQYRGEVGHSRFVDALIDVNGGVAIQAGQAIRLP